MRAQKNANTPVLPLFADEAAAETQTRTESRAKRRSEPLPPNSFFDANGELVVFDHC